MKFKSSDDRFTINYYGILTPDFTSGSSWSLDYDEDRVTEEESCALADEADMFIHNAETSARSVMWKRLYEQAAYVLGSSEGRTRTSLNNLVVLACKTLWGEGYLGEDAETILASDSVLYFHCFKYGISINCFGMASECDKCTSCPAKEICLEFQKLRESVQSLLPVGEDGTKFDLAKDFLEKISNIDFSSLQIDRPFRTNFELVDVIEDDRADCIRKENMAIKHVTFNRPECRVWSDAPGEDMLVKIDHTMHTIETAHIRGGNVDFEWFMSFIMNDPDIRRELMWALTSYKRLHPVFSEGTLSGEWTLYYAPFPEVKEWATTYRRYLRKAISIRVSCFRKIADMPSKMFAGDILELVGDYLSMRGYEPMESFEFFLRTGYFMATVNRTQYRMKPLHYITPLKVREPYCGSMADEDQKEISL